VSQASGWIAVGRIGRAHGVKGEVTVLPLSEVASRFESGSLLFAGEGGDRPLTVATARRHRARLVVSFAEVGDRTQAEALVGTYLFVSVGSVPPLPEGTWWPHELVGCDVVTEGGRSLGTIREVVHGPANDLWATEGAGGEVLVPALKDVVRRVDLDGRRIVVREVPGLTGD
jgi:16S rRNA processing protein RimM